MTISNETASGDRCAGNGDAVVFIMNPSPGHILPTLPLARSNKDRGRRVIYIGFESMRKWVVGGDFEFVAVQSVESWDSVFFALVGLKIRKAFAMMEGLLVELEAILQKINPAMVYIDYLFPAFAVPCMTLKLRFARLSVSYYGQTPSFAMPPITSGVRYRDGLWGRVVNAFAWARHTVNLFGSPVFVLTTIFGPGRTLRRVAKHNDCGLEWTGYNWNARSDVFALAPRSFDFPGPSSQRYLGLCLDLNRRGPATDKYEPEGGGGMVFCSLGTLSSRYKRANAILDAFGRAANMCTGIQFVIQAGSLYEGAIKRNLGTSARYLDLCDQLGMLQKASVFVTHGGFGSVLEAIYFNVPLVVLPCSYDHHGIARRVEFHGIGIVLRGRAQRSAKAIELAIRDAFDRRVELQANMKRLRGLIIQESRGLRDFNAL